MIHSEVLLRHVVPFLKDKDLCELMQVCKAYLNVAAHTLFEVRGATFRLRSQGNFERLLDVPGLAFDHDIELTEELQGAVTLFHGVCISGKLPLAKRLNDEFALSENEVLHDAGLHRKMLEATCKSGHLALVVWYVETFNITSLDVHEGIDNTCGSHMFCVTSHHGHLHIAKWLTARFDLTSLYADEDIQSEYDRAFIIACSRGHLQFAKWLYATFYLSCCRAGETAPMDYACSDGRFGIVLWLSRVATPTWCEEAGHPKYRKNILTRACQSGNLAMVKWLMEETSLSQYIKRDNILDAFALTCRSGQIWVAKWLVARFDITTANDDDKPCIHNAFSHACTNGCLHVVKWLASTFKSLLVLENALYSYKHIYTWANCLQHVHRSATVR